MIEFPYEIFTKTPDFPIHLQYGYHDADLYQHTHGNFFELVIVLNGSAQHVVGNASFPIGKGAVFVVGNQTPHGYANPDHLTICNIMFRQDVFDTVFDIRQLAGFQALFVLEPHYSQNYHFLSQLHLSAGAFAQAEALLNAMMQEYEGRHPGWQDAVYADFRRLCIMLSRRYQADAEATNDYIKLADAVAHIEHHFNEELTLAALAAISGYSERQFLRLFKAAFSVTPNQYIADLRLRKAQQLLSCTALSVGETALQCGFPDQNYFTKFFRSRTGQTPSAFRRAGRGE
ncbi:MAG: helix-turn-helix domain-containing protein [Oscillospiraceae bacterium]|nr:helix-turn-helix domain-containing protein [Oscillospiraceae bacterium]